MVRPQLVVGLIAGLCVCCGLFVISAQPPAAHVRAVAVYKPIAYHVQSASVSLPVDCAKVACMALTFDDGPSAGVTPQVLDILDRHQAHATFFMIGARVGGNEELLRRMHRAGHEIGNHSWDHPDLTTLSPEDVEQEVAKTQAAIAAAGVPVPRLFRLPYGAIDPMVRSHVPLTIVSWNIDPEDWKAKKPEKVVEHVLSHARPGAIVDLHDIHQLTADSLDPMLSGLEANYRLVTVSQLLGLPPGQPGIFYSR